MGDNLQPFFSEELVIYDLKGKSSQLPDFVYKLVSGRQLYLPVYILLIVLQHHKGEA
jgi:hypothetical protein